MCPGSGAQRRPDSGDEVAQHLQPLPADFGARGMQTGNIFTGAVEAVDNSGTDWIANGGENDGYGCGGGLRRLCSQRSETRNEHVWFGVDEIGGELRQPCRLPFGGAEVQVEFLPSA